MKLSVVLSGIAARFTSAIATSLAPLYAVARSRPAFALSTRDAGSARVTHSPAPSVRNRSAGSLGRPAQTPGFEVVRMVFSLTHLSGSNGVTQEAVGGRSDWTNPTNAQGKRDGSSAGFAGNALGARGGLLRLAYANFANKADLTITSVKLKFYVATAGTVGNNALVVLGYAKGAGDVTLETITGDVSSLTTPREFNLTTQVTSWTDLDNLVAYVSAASDLGEIWTASLDAVELEVLANRTDAL